MYIVLALCRLTFYFYNASVIGPVGSREIWPLIKGSLLFDTSGILYANAFFILLSLIPLRVREKKWYRGVMFGYYMAANSLAVIANMADCIYFRYTQKRFTADELFFAGNDNNLRLVLRFAAENWPLVLVGAALIWLLWGGYGRKTVPRTPLRNPVAYHVFGLLVLGAAGGLVVAGIRGGFTRSTRPVTLSNATLYASSVGKANLVLSNPFCIIRTLGNQKIEKTEYFPPEELAEIFTPYHYPQANPGTAPLTGRNVIVFILESFSAEHSAYLSPELYPDGGGYTPFLDSLMRTGLTFRRGYANGHKSIEALPAVLGSIPSFRTPFVLLPQSLGASRQFPAILRDKGYATAFFNGSSRGSMGFGAYAASAGIERLYGREDYESVRGKGDFDGYWGIWDEPFLLFMGETLSGFPQPFMAAVFTLSSHHPFVIPEKYREEFSGGITKIHPGVRYTDNAIRLFFERFGNEEWFRNTVFVFTADHVSSETFAPQTRTLLGGTRIVEFIYAPDGAVGGTVDEPVQQLDLMPTLLGLMGNRESYFAFGRDVLSERDRPAAAVGFSTAAMSYYITDGRLLILFDGKRTKVYTVSDTAMNNPLPEPYGEEASRLSDLLKAVIQQYNARLLEKNYTVPETRLAE